MMSSMDEMTKEEARKLALEKLAEAWKLLEEAGELADEKRFDLEFLGSVYVPKDPTDEEKEAGEWPTEIGYDEVVPGGWWLPSMC